jgi:hypothetical protein
MAANAEIEALVESFFRDLEARRLDVDIGASDDAVSDAWKERQRWLEAVNYARASVLLEGFKLSEADEQRAARFVAGEIDLAGFISVRS